MINTVTIDNRAVVEQYFAKMQAGPAGIDDLVGLFDDKAIYVEPFSGKPQTHSGKAEIRAFFEVALSQHLKGVRLTLDRLDIDEGRLRAEWTCELPMFPRPMRGFDLLTLTQGLIARLETTVTEFPPAPQA